MERIVFQAALFFLEVSSEVKVFQMAFLSQTAGMVENCETSHLFTLKHTFKICVLGCCGGISGFPETIK